MANEMRDRLVKLIETAKKEWWEKSGRYQTSKASADYIADCLLDDGWVRPPCKVGDTVYYPYEYGNVVLEKTVIKIVIEKEDRWLDVGVSFLPFENIGKTVFLTKAEAEQKLKEMRGADNG